MMNYTTTTEKETKSLGEKLGKDLNLGEIVILQGDLGSGKTTFTKGMAKGLGITEIITSPTFSLMNIYEYGENSLIHIDTYRLENERDLLDIGIEDYLGKPNTITIIEWPEKIKNLLNKKMVTEITITHKNKNEREITASRKVYTLT
ncbi:MAG: tRNA (adenosine(37)-N6)-threonylcarbamoyltransferase complex ATPase subunit type 1 TsaE [Candidatus Magasanikbacteria bacterium]|jgi:tRNA threonylcarbamoyladenosine biosynthesis protein TsaE|nr:tRNA (adenosine(37)-N6)-threonylcarbamoyltransferase complex ATPase subunit type 1 TsaE [Candidatus Magasanikbacteria bacterium]MBT4221446.1 tRNA (adenosine(37)-N6)-threonylcarbamoyltransferase complex ATPase subunit type 1 TsaE [Candidatus Magasanikbacteria bacterium]MBT4350706.1 tRNA (adenosine(37)-N6)-threonylcarbamoyltransferase complex ATPase subunit type 1 TsaE [Candidatus Magasanikbacteria bacterium]MBT4541618.1 tRNA (adenosine(37)-N6)-threonylcarbamoyltransferase complex ATPase subuni